MPRPQLQRQHGVVEEQAPAVEAVNRTAPSAGTSGDVLPPVPVPQVLGARPATPAPIALPIAPPQPALAHSEPLMPPTIYMDVIPPTSVAAPGPSTQFPPNISGVQGATSHFQPIPSTSIEQMIPSLPPFPTLRPDLAALMQSEIPATEPNLASQSQGQGVKRPLETTQTSTGKQSKKAR